LYVFEYYKNPTVIRSKPKSGRGLKGGGYISGTAIGVVSIIHPIPINNAPNGKSGVNNIIVQSSMLFFARLCDD
jgi:hypothetical protein